MRQKKLLVMFLALSLLFFSFGCQTDDDDDAASPATTTPSTTDTGTTDTGTTDTTNDATETDQFETLRAAVEPVIAKGTGGLLQNADVSIVNDSNLQIVSVRSATDFAKGHIQGAINIPWKEVLTSAEAGKLDKTKTQIVYCYTSNSGAYATMILNLTGYNAKNMKYGMMAWNNDTAVGGVAFNSAEFAGNAYDTETTDRTSSTPYELPKIMTKSTTAMDVAKEQYTAFVGKTWNITITAADVKVISDGIISSTAEVMLADGTTKVKPADYQIVSIRSAEHYALGHVPGAINIPFADIVKADSLKKLDPTKILIVYCYTGHTGGLATASLNLLGYQARNLKYGIQAYTDDDTVLATGRFSGGFDATTTTD